MPPTERWPGVPTMPAASASLANFFSLASSPAATRKTTFMRERDVFFDGADVVAVAVVDGVVEKFGFGFVALSRLPAMPPSDVDPVHDQADDVDREGRRRVVEGLFLDVGAVLEKRGEIFVGALGEIFADDDHRCAAGAKIFLRAGKDQAEFLYIDGAGGDVGRHVGDKRRGAGFRHGVILRALDGVVGAHVDVGRLGRELDFALCGHAGEFLRLGGGGDVVQDAFFQFAESFGGPGAGVEQVDGLAGEAEVHRDHGELHAAATLQEEDGVVVGDRQMLAQAGFGGGVDAFEFGRAVGHFHDGHAGAVPVEEFFADALEYGKGKRGRSCVEVEGALGGACCGGGAHDGVILSVVVLRRGPGSSPLCV